MQRQATSNAPQEVCGLLAGKDCRVSKLFLIENELHSSSRFRMKAQSQLNAFLAIENLGIDLLAYYHSHPLGGGEPSAIDLTEFLYPDVVMLIWFQHEGTWQAKAWDIQGTLYSPVILEVTEL
jgi:[CysO sulfur-carrier protein]-S-L-cysteine hydrolase